MVRNPYMIILVDKIPHHSFCYFYSFGARLFGRQPRSSYNDWTFSNRFFYIVCLYVCIGIEFYFVVIGHFFICKWQDSPSARWGRHPAGS